MSGDKPIYPRVPPHVVAVETISGRCTYHAFKSIAQRDDWIRMCPEMRRMTTPHSVLVHRAWADFSIVLHPDTDVRKVLR